MRRTDAVSEITGLARSTIGRGLKDSTLPTAERWVRRKGGAAIFVEPEPNADR